MTAATWVKCPVCGHKLFKISGAFTPLTVVAGEQTTTADIEVKCHSCKDIVNITILDIGGKKT